jgi:kynurenine formamidase
MNSARLLAVVAILGAASCAPSGPARQSATAPRYVDLTHDLSSQSIFWHTGETFRLDSVANGVTDKGYFYASNNYSGNEHGGTHIDAPIHFAEGRWTVDKIPLERLIGPAVVVDVTSAAASNPDY